VNLPIPLCNSPITHYYFILFLHTSHCSDPSIPSPIASRLIRHRNLTLLTREKSKVMAWTRSFRTILAFLAIVLLLSLVTTTEARLFGRYRPRSRQDRQQEQSIEDEREQQRQEEIVEQPPCVIQEDGTVTNECPDGSFCQVQGGRCSGSGICVRMSRRCTKIYRPVCSCDGETYGNACVAAGHGKNILTDCV